MLKRSSLPRFSSRSRNTPADSSTTPKDSTNCAPPAAALPPPGKPAETNVRHSKMMHNVKLQLKGTGKKKILREDTGLAATDQTLSEWHASVSALLNAINTNENAWNGLFSTFDAFNPIAMSIYPQKDSEALEFSASLSAVRKQLESPPPGVESYVDAKQRIDITKKDLENLLARIGNARAMQAKRIEVTREHRYYTDKTQSMTQAEQKKGQLTEKEIGRRQRNESHLVEKSTELYTLTNQLFYEMDAIAVERLAAVDRAMAAMILLQYHYFASNPVSASYAIASRIGLGRRVLIRHETRPWNPNDGDVKPTPHTATSDASSTTSFGGSKTDSWVPQPISTPGAPPPPPPPPPDTPMYSVPAINPNLAQQSPSLQPQPMAHQYGSQYTPGQTMYSTPMSQTPNSAGDYYNQSGSMDQGNYYGGHSQPGGGYQTPPPPPPPPEDPSMNSQSHVSPPPPPPPATTGMQQSTSAPPPPGVEPPHPGTPLQGTFVLPDSTHSMPGQSPAPIYTTASSGGVMHTSNGSSQIPPPPPPPSAGSREQPKEDDGFVDAS